MLSTHPSSLIISQPYIHSNFLNPFLWQLDPYICHLLCKEVAPQVSLILILCSFVFDSPSLGKKTVCAQLIYDPLDFMCLYKVSTHSYGRTILNPILIGAVFQNSVWFHKSNAAKKKNFHSALYIEFKFLFTILMYRLAHSNRRIYANNFTVHYSSLAVLISSMIFQCELRVQPGAEV